MRSRDGDSYPWLTVLSLIVFSFTTLYADDYLISYRYVVKNATILNEKLYQTKKTFYDISLLETFIKNLSKIKSNIQKLEKMVSAMIDEGYAKKVDLLEVSAKKSAVDRMLHEAKFNKELALQYLSFLLNKDVNSIVVVYDEVPMINMSKESMLEKNIDIQKAKMGYSITAMAIELEKSAFRPMAGAFAEYGSADDTPLGEFSDHDFYTIGFQVKWNLFNGQIDKQKLEKAKAENLKVKDQVEFAKKGIGLMIDKIKTEIKSLESEINSLEKELDFAKEVYENYLGRYQEKLVSINDVIIKQSIEIEKTLKLQEEKNKRNERVFILEKIAGVEK
jgi:outer membrane protein TolC